MGGAEAIGGSALMSAFCFWLIQQCYSGDGAVMNEKRGPPPRSPHSED